MSPVHLALLTTCALTGSWEMLAVIIVTYQSRLSCKNTGTYWFMPAYYQTHISQIDNLRNSPSLSSLYHDTIFGAIPVRSSYNFLWRNTRRTVTWNIKLAWKFRLTCDFTNYWGVNRKGAWENGSLGARVVRWTAAPLVHVKVKSLHWRSLTNLTPGLNNPVILGDGYI